MDTSAHTTRTLRYESRCGCLLFPDLKGTTLAQVNLDAEQFAFAQRHPELFGNPAVNPLLDPRVCQQMVSETHDAHGVDWSYGGYLEDRCHLWRGSYLSAKGTYLHLGVDFNVPQGTRVAVVEDSLVMLVDEDTDFDGGWGPRVFLKLSTTRRSRIVQIFAHLQAVRVKPGDRLAPGAVFAEVGGHPHNGNWHPHLHIQAVRELHFQEILIERFSELDGYGHQNERSMLRRDFPDPLRRIPGFTASKRRA
ncbi:MAG: peptidoglycan DD-metalloendopeptidase family protein [Verrucomicrobia bacterium]|nr:peptidoglycan DD-metalloendopeptidase family protein [Verrucomicrobiota bacterium]